MYCLRIFLYILSVGTGVSAITFLIGGNYIAAGVLAFLTAVVMGFEALAGWVAESQER